MGLFGGLTQPLQQSYLENSPIEQILAEPKILK